MNMSIAENICLPSLGKLSKKGLLTKKKIKEFAQDQAAKMSVRMVNTEQPVSDLSGGNKQKVVFARWLGTDADILVLDSPALGTDIKVKQDIYRLMEEMRKTRKSIILISEDLRELIGMCDRVLIMKDGKLNGELHRDKGMDENSLIERMV
jgi:ribose transport system ATP-binding protein